MVPTVERGLCDADFCSIEIAGDNPSIVSTSGLSIIDKNCHGAHDIPIHDFGAIIAVQIADGDPAPIAGIEGTAVCTAGGDVWQIDTCEL